MKLGGPNGDGLGVATLKLGLNFVGTPLGCCSGWCAIAIGWGGIAVPPFRPPLPPRPPRTFPPVPWGPPGPAAPPVAEPEPPVVPVEPPAERPGLRQRPLGVPEP